MAKRGVVFTVMIGWVEDYHFTLLYRVSASKGLSTHTKGARETIIPEQNSMTVDSTAVACDFT